MKKTATLVGKVVHGKGLGRTVGMPTANIDINPESLEGCVESGVYASRITIGTEGFTAVTNVGCRPSVDDDPKVTVESHILDFDRDIYDRIVTLEIGDFLRPIQKLPSLQAVMEQVQKDIAKTRALAAGINLRR